jgi:hypothetical protein
MGDPYGKYIGIFAAQNTAKGDPVSQSISRVYGKGEVPIKSGWSQTRKTT